MSDNKLAERILQKLQDEPTRSFSAEKIARAIGMPKADEFTPVVQALAQLERDGKVEVTDLGEFKLVIKSQPLTGSFRGNERGFGFVNYDANMSDIYINSDDTLHAMNGDQVAVKILRQPKPGSDMGPVGKVTEIIEHHYQHMVGEFKTLTLGNFIGEIILKDKKLSNFKFYVTDKGLKPMDGEVVDATIATYPSDDAPGVITGAVQAVIGDEDQPGVDIMSSVIAHDVPHEFPEDVKKEAAAIPDHVLPEEKEGRKDVTDQPLVTIDAIESKDLDDAVVAWKLDNGNYHLGVHIADVTHYVHYGSPLDREAYKRGTSVYLTDRVIPMLPKKLSNGICSLNPGEERLAMGCEMEINPQGQVVNSWIGPTLMKSHARMTYKAVNAIIEDHDPQACEEYHDLVPMFETMNELHHILAKHRHERGAIDFDAPEAKIIVDSDGHPTDIELRERRTAERLVESLMLAANETVAKTFFNKHVPFLYRVHETPDQDRMKDFLDFLGVFGITVHGNPNHVTPKMLQQVLKDVAGKPEEQMVQVMMLRSMQQARYSEDELGHFGLAAKFYTHFTSPIRRYPDEMVHRMIKWYTANGTGAKAQAKFKDDLSEIAEHTSDTERRGIDTERDVDSMKKAEYMQDHVGETFDAQVSSVMKFGLFVELPNTVEGLVHISAMTDDYYEYDEKHLALIGRRTHRIFQIGQPLQVKLLRVDKDQREVDFELVNPENAPKTKLRVAGSSHGHGHGGHGNRNHDHRGVQHHRGHSGHTQHRSGDHNVDNGQRNSFQINRGQTRHSGDEPHRGRRRHNKGHRNHRREHDFTIRHR